METPQNQDDMVNEAAPEDGNVLFDAVITPHRSLSPQGFTLLMITIGAISFICGIVFMIAGAWPVLGFFGLDVGLIYLAFRLNYRAARAIEQVRLTRDELTIRRLDHRGRGIEIGIQPFWLKVEVVGDGCAEEIRLRSHGEIHTVGAYLCPPERVAFAKELMAALATVREPHHIAAAAET
jgi:uncharacterized membrane protein